MNELILKTCQDICDSCPHGATRAVTAPDAMTIVGKIEAQAHATPGRKALRFRDRILTYGVLDRKATEVAQFLVAQGVGKGEMLPIAISNSLEMPIAWIAALKVGAIFIPVDPEWPSARLREIGAVTEARVFLVAEKDRAMSLGGAKRLSVSIDSPLRGIAIPPSRRSEAGDVIYGYFTSGSTGTPKCALNLNRGLVNRFDYMTRRFADCPEPVVYQNTRHVFDSSLWQVLWPLTIGGMVVIPPSTVGIDIDAIIAEIDASEAQMTDFVPSIFCLLTRHLEQNPDAVARLSSLRHIFLGGEAANLNAVGRFRGLMPAVTLTNTYGPTEASIGSVFHEITGTERDEIPLGDPIDNTHVLLLGDDGQPVEPGQIGEIHIGGIGIGAGYLNAPDKTREAFRPNTFPPIPGETIYKTGDLGMIGPDGKLRFRGRIDSQVKLNGARIELAEVECTVLRHDAVAEAVVLLDDEAEALVVFAVLRTPVETSELRTFLTARLPRYSVPSRYIVIDALPLTGNGKADRLALIALARRARGEVGTSPSGTMAQIPDLFAKVLKRAAVRADDDFFCIGGDSLRAVELAQEIQEAFGRKLEPAAIFENPTPQRLARLLDGVSSAADKTDAETWEHHFELDLPVRYDTPQRPKSLLFLGATGFVGRHMLDAIVRKSAGDGTQIVCLVRGSRDREAAERLASALQAARLPVANIMSRVTVLRGDLAHERFAIGADLWFRLMRDMDAVVHVGGSVDFLKTYEHQERTNVGSVRAIIELMSSGRPKHLHYVSSLSIAACKRDRPLDEWCVPLQPPEGGYNKTKWVAERILVEARQRGMRCSVYRLGEAMESTRTGVANDTSLITLMIEACRILRLVPEEAVHLDYTPVDFVGQLIARFVMDEYREAHVLNVFNPQEATLSQYLGRAPCAEIPYRTATYQAFFSALEHKIGEMTHTGRENTKMLRLAQLRVLLPHPSEVGATLDAVISSPRFSWRQDALMDVLRRTGTAYPRMSTHPVPQSPAANEIREGAVDDV